jgi:hypothetical protein
MGNMATNAFLLRPPLHNEELRNLYSSPSTSIIGVIKSRRIRWARHVARMGKRYAYKILVGKPEERPLG